MSPSDSPPAAPLPLDSSRYDHPLTAPPEAAPEASHDGLDPDELRHVAKLAGRVRYLECGTRCNDRHNRAEIAALRWILQTILGVNLPPPENGPREPSVYIRTAPPGVSRGGR